MEDLTKEKLVIFIKKQRIPIILVSLVLVIAVSGFAIFRGSQKTLPATNGRTGNSINQPNVTPTKKPFNPFAIFDKPEETDDSNKSTADTSLKNIHSGNPLAPIPSSIKKIQSDGKVTAQPLVGGSIVQTTQGTINSTGNIQTGVDSNTQVDNIRIVFQNPDGTTTTYIPPGTPPDEVRWGRYSNTTSKYAINIPINWQFVYSIDGNGHEGVALYPPNVNVNDPNVPYIGFGITESFLLPVAGNVENSYTTPLIVDGITGTLYTNGSLGNSYVASVLQYSGKYFGLGASKSDATFAYVYYYMINSLTFNTE